MPLYSLTSISSSVVTPAEMGMNASFPFLMRMREGVVSTPSLAASPGLSARTIPFILQPYVASKYRRIPSCALQ